MKESSDFGGYSDLEIDALITVAGQCWIYTKLSPIF